MGLQPQPAGPHPSLTAGQVRAASVHVADRVAAEYPHPLDDHDPVSAGRSTAYDRRARTTLLDLLGALGLHHDTAPGGTA